nr:hypothetical protein [Paludibacterium yongneupense]
MPGQHPDDENVEIADHGIVEPDRQAFPAELVEKGVIEPHSDHDDQCEQAPQESRSFAAIGGKQEWKQQVEHHLDADRPPVEGKVAIAPVSGAPRYLAGARQVQSEQIEIGQRGGLPHQGQIGQKQKADQGVDAQQPVFQKRPIVQRVRFAGGNPEEQKTAKGEEERHPHVQVQPMDKRPADDVKQDDHQRRDEAQMIECGHIADIDALHGSSSGMARPEETPAPAPGSRRSAFSEKSYSRRHRACALPASGDNPACQ